VIKVRILCFLEKRVFLGNHRHVDCPASRAARYRCYHQRRLVRRNFVAGMLGVDLWHEAGGGGFVCFERALPKKLGETSVSVAGVAAP